VGDWGGVGKETNQSSCFDTNEGREIKAELLEFSRLNTARTCTFKTQPVSRFILSIFKHKKTNSPDSPLGHHGLHQCSPTCATRRRRPSLSKIDAVGVGCCRIWFGVEERLVQRK